MKLPTVSGEDALNIAAVLVAGGATITAVLCKADAAGMAAINALTIGCFAVINASKRPTPPPPAA